MRAVLILGLFLVAALPACASQFPIRKEFTNALGMKFVRLEAGKFMMGQGEAPPASREEWETRDRDESPRHKVKLSRPLYMGAYEVTNAQYEAFDPDHKELRGKFGVSLRDDEPVTFVTWQQAVDFCRWLSKKEGLAYRLPTEAEWEYACRAGTTTIYNTGDILTPKDANIGLSVDAKKKITTVPAGSYKPNAWGLYDMHSNVEEWCLDWYGPYEEGEQIDPVGREDGYARITRGGSYSVPSWREDSARYCRSANRSGYLPQDANRCVGFRALLGEMPTSAPLPVAPLPLFQQNVKRTPASKEGPDPNKPYFVNFTEAGTNPRIPEESWGPLFSHWNHDTALCVCPNGDVLAVWYTTVSESGRELALAASRLRAGASTWEQASLFFDVPDVNDHAPALLSDGERIYHFCNQALSSWVDAALIMRISEDSGATWSKPSSIMPRGKNPDNPLNKNMPVCAFVANDGTLCLVSDADRRKSCLLVSKDKGKTWKLTPGLIEGIHAATTQVEDGRVVAFGRYPDPMPVSVSKDLGETWEYRETPFGGISVGNRAAALKLASGALLLCAQDTRKPPITGRRGSFAALSFDGGKTWPHIRKLPGVRGYLSAAQAPNGVIYVFGTRMSAVAFNQAWVQESELLGAAAGE